MDTSDGPLRGIRVVEIGQLIAGPYCGQLLGDFGAEVIKVEHPDKPDPMRNWGTLLDGESLPWRVISRNKSCRTADLGSPEGVQVARDLVATADILIENFRPGTMERFGLGWTQLHALNPRLIMVRISGYGQTGPYAGKAGYGSIGEAMGGLRYLSGDPDRPPSRIGVSIGDMLAGQQGAYGALLALRAREHSGQGQVVDVSIYESVLAMTEGLIPEFALTGRIRERTGSVLPGVAPSNLYPTADGTYLLIAANQDSVFGRLAAAMNRPELAQQQEFATHTARGARQEELDELISQWTKTLNTAELIGLMDEYGVPCGRVYTAREMLDDSHFQARDSIVETYDPSLGIVPMQNVSPKLSDTPGRVRWPGTTRGHEINAAEPVGERR